MTDRRLEGDKSRSVPVVHPAKCEEEDYDYAGEG